MQACPDVATGSLDFGWAGDGPGDTWHDVMDPLDPVAGPFGPLRGPEIYRRVVELTPVLVGTADGIRGSRVIAG